MNEDAPLICIPLNFGCAEVYGQLQDFQGWFHSKPLGNFRQLSVTRSVPGWGNGCTAAYLKPIESWNFIRRHPWQVKISMVSALDGTHVFDEIVSIVLTWFGQSTATRGYVASYVMIAQMHRKLFTDKIVVAKPITIVQVIMMVGKARATYARIFRPGSITSHTRPQRWKFSYVIIIYLDNSSVHHVPRWKWPRWMRVGSSSCVTCSPQKGAGFQQAPVKKGELLKNLAQKLLASEPKWSPNWGHFVK